MKSESQQQTVDPAPPQRFAALRIFGAAFLILFLELALIRWIPANVRVVSYFSNLVLLACFLGMGVGCLLAWIRWPLVRTAPVFFVALLLLTRYFRDQQVVSLASHDQVHLWLQYTDLPPGVKQIGIPPVLSLFFATASLMFLALGHAFGRAFASLRALKAYSVDIVGSLVGTLGFAAMAWFETPPWVWFLTAGLVLAAYLGLRSWMGWVALAVYAAGTFLVYQDCGDSIWSRYYRITWTKRQFGLTVNVNASFHQMAVDMRPVNTDQPLVKRTLQKFSVPYEFVSPDRVLILGAGTGNDVVVAKNNGARHITAVEIDPAIAQLGIEQNNARPYQKDGQAEVRLVIDDARSFLKRCREQFDLIVFGTLDSQALLSGVSSLRLENFVYTRECWTEAKRLLAPGGVMATYYSVAQPWILDKLVTMSRAVYQRDPALFYFEKDQFLFNTILLQGGSAARPLPDKLRGYAADLSADPSLIPTDDWPFLYLNERRVLPDVAWVIGFGLVWTLLLAGGSQFASQRGFSPAFFLLGAGFMLLEAKGITEMSLLFGSTWTVNVMVISSILLMILLANIVITVWPVRRVEWLFAGVLICLALRGLLPIGEILQQSGPMTTVLAVLRVGAPVFFAALIFATLFSRTTMTTVALGANLVGAMAGGFSEHLSVVWGFRALDWLAFAFYSAAFLSVLAFQPRRSPPAATQLS
ncbi:MAG: hypothetical protein HZB38_12575 [Planctomycetes bacterium]|nr:hypothetical protein [Planctomycetota bacterium]